jgi:hypothetical protein
MPRIFDTFHSEPKRKGQRDEVLPKENDGSPDSNRPSGLCPRCGKQSSFEIIGSLPATFDYESFSVSRDGQRQPDLIDRVTSLICRHCNQGVIVIEEQWIAENPKKKQNSGGIVSFRGIHWWPLPEAKLSPDVPANIASVFTEEVLTLSANCPRASAVMSRRTLEAITVEKGETKGSLAERLGNLGTKGILHPTLSEWAKEVRLVGNAGAHFDPIEKVTIDDARQLVNFIRELLKFLYELPAELQKRRSQP